MWTSKAYFVAAVTGTTGWQKLETSGSSESVRRSPTPDGSVTPQSGLYANQDEPFTQVAQVGEALATEKVDLSEKESLRQRPQVRKL